MGEQGEQAPIPIESRVARESEADDPDSGPRSNGTSADGATGIRFETDRPVDDVATLLASLRPFDPSRARTAGGDLDRGEGKTPVRRAAALVACGHQRKEVVQRMNDSSHGTLEVAGR